MNLLTVSALTQAVTEYLNNSAYMNEYPVEGPISIAMQEGGSNTAYLDSRNNWTIGVGHRPAHPGEVWSTETMISVFFNDIYSKAYLPVNQNLLWVANLSPQRQWVNYNASFNMGFGRWSAFDETFQNMQSGNLMGVLLGMQQSKWFTEVPNRVKALMYQYYFDTWVIGYLNEEQTSQIDALLNQLGASLGSSLPEETSV